MSEAAGRAACAHIGGRAVGYAPDDLAPGGRIGLIALATDCNSETDLRRLLPDGVDLFTNRVANANPVTLENLRAMRDDITRAAGGILPGFGIDAMIYGCTSGTVAIGEAEVRARVQAARPGVPCTNPVAATRAALRAFGAQRIAILTPYTEAVNSALAERYRADGFDVLGIDGFGLDDDEEMTALPPSAIVEAALAACHARAQALFISCTALRAASVVGELEQRLAIPVVTSNQALVWHALQLMGNRSPVPGFGRLLERPAAPSSPGATDRAC